MADAVVDDLADLVCVPLRFQSVGTRAGSVIVGTVTLLVEHRRQGRVRRASNPPRLLDWLSRLTAVLGYKTIHAAVELGVNEAPRHQELVDERGAPVAARSRPLDEDTSADAESVISHAHEGLP